ncbi:hypothetical protein LTR85_012261 [Meristemomyces frigidus]|nr:hypothetical protein LTR85_012261 [Meristemomyces frigidus]
MSVSPRDLERIINDVIRDSAEELMRHNEELKSHTGKEKEWRVRKEDLRRMVLDNPTVSKLEASTSDKEMYFDRLVTKKITYVVKKQKNKEKEKAQPRGSSSPASPAASETVLLQEEQDTSGSPSAEG